MPRQWAADDSVWRQVANELRKRKLIKTLPGHKSTVVAMPGPWGLPG